VTLPSTSAGLRGRALDVGLSFRRDRDAIPLAPLRAPDLAPERHLGRLEQLPRMVNTPFAGDPTEGLDRHVALAGFKPLDLADGVSEELGGFLLGPLSKPALLVEVLPQDERQTAGVLSSHATAIVAGRGRRGPGNGLPGAAPGWVAASETRRDRVAFSLDGQGAGRYSKPMERRALRRRYGRAGHTNVSASNFRSGKGANFKLSYLPYAGLEPYPSRFGFGHYEEFFKTRHVAQTRMRHLIDQGIIEEAEIHQAVGPGGHGLRLVDEWHDVGARGAG
jgi:hypothetical protein